MASQGPNNPTSAANITNVFTDWTDPTNVLASDDTYAVATNTPTGAQTDQMRANGFGFSIPTGATIDGVVVEIEKSTTALDINDDTVYLENNPDILSSNKADTTTDWPAMDAYATYGASNDLWGATLTPTIVNSSTFGVRIAAKNNGGIDGTPRIDHIRMTIYYTPLPSFTPTVTMPPIAILCM